MTAQLLHPIIPTTTPAPQKKQEGKEKEKEEEKVEEQQQPLVYTVFLGSRTNTYRRKNLPPIDKVYHIGKRGNNLLMGTITGFCRAPSRFDETPASHWGQISVKNNTVEELMMRNEPIPFIEYSPNKDEYFVVCEDIRPYFCQRCVKIGFQ